MAYDAGLPTQALQSQSVVAPSPTSRRARPRRVRTLTPAADAFARHEQLALWLGAVAAGAVLGFCIAVGTGRQTFLITLSATVVALGLAYYLTLQTLRDAQRRRARPCCFGAAIHRSALLAWPLAMLAAPFNVALYWIAPILALAGLALFASCWRGAPRAVYRTTLLAGLVSMLAAHNGAMLVLAA